MYESPISIIQEQLTLKMEDDILKAVQKYEIVVNKEELMKALSYDRDQFSKGYREGKEDAFREMKKLIMREGYWYDR